MAIHGSINGYPALAGYLRGRFITLTNRICCLLLALALIVFTFPCSALALPENQSELLGGTLQPKLEPLPQHPKIKAYFNYNQADVYTDPYRQIERYGNDLEKQIIAQINLAQQSIDIAVQAISLPLIVQTLTEKFKAGVKIRWIADNSYVEPWGSLTHEELASLNSDDLGLAIEFTDLIDEDEDGLLSPEEIVNRDIFSLFDRSGIPYLDDTADGSKGSGLMHHKFMVIDNHVVVTGSANFTLSGLQVD